jgi:hypothetical protein
MVAPAQTAATTPTSAVTGVSFGAGTQAVCPAARAPHLTTASQPAT